MKVHFNVNKMADSLTVFFFKKKTKINFKSKKKSLSQKKIRRKTHETWIEKKTWKEKPFELKN